MKNVGLLRHRTTGGLVRFALVLGGLGLPVAWLAPGCGARTDIGETESAPGTGGNAPDGGQDAPNDAPNDVPVDVPADAPNDVPVDVPFDVPMDVPVDVPFDMPMDVPMDVPIDVPIDVPEDVAEDVLEDVVEDVAEDVPADVPEDVPADVPADVPSDGACPDADGDGYGTCDNDCNDNNPLVNPGAFDFPNGVDDDCDGGVDNPAITCGGGLLYTSQDAMDYAKAIDICQLTAAGAMGADKKWGLISAALVLADGTQAPAAKSHAIITSFGSVLGPKKNENFAFFSTGLAGTPSQPYFAFGTPQGGTDFQVSGNPPVPPVPLPLGFPTNKQGCALPSPQAHDSVNLKLSLRVPTNASSFGFNHAFFSAEYPEYACTVFNDMWVVLLDTDAPGIANNKDIVFDAQGTPGSMNLNFFDRCIAGSTGCFGGPPGFNFCSGGKGELAGTGYDVADMGCSPGGNTSSMGGGTGWLMTEAPVVPGETITVQFVIWDSTDGVYDSSVIFDNFHWIAAPLATPKTYR
jgi:hypothetical protein